MMFLLLHTCLETINHTKFGIQYSRIPEKDCVEILNLESHINKQTNLATAKYDIHIEHPPINLGSWILDLGSRFLNTGYEVI